MAATKDAPVGYPIPTLPDPTPPKRIIYREIDIEVNPATMDINIVYLDHNEPKEGNIDRFLETVLAKPTVHQIPFTAATSPLDLNCKEDCYIIFRLADDWNWQFSPETDAFTTKDYENDKYFSLVHVLYDKATKLITKIDPGEAPGEGCKTLYFRARGREAGYNDGFNLIVDLDLGITPGPNPTKRRTKIVIDPDIRNPGGSMA